MAPETAVYAAMKHAREPELQNASERAGGPGAAAAAAAIRRARRGACHPPRAQREDSSARLVERRWAGEAPAWGDGDYEAARADPDEARHAKKHTPFVAIGTCWDMAYKSRRDGRGREMGCL